MFNTDQPISSENEDLLGRHSFAKYLAKAILSYKQKDSLSIGLCGEWGAGKTSIINMTLEEVRGGKSKTEQPPIIIEFNPWNFSEQNQLMQQFFNELSSALNRKDNAGKYIKIGNTIQKYARFFEPFSYIPVLSEIGNAAKAIKNVGMAAVKAGEKETKNLSTVKKELNGLLEEIDTKLIIVIDDIDRLNNTEIRQIFQLVKSLADFKNTVYLLPFDKKVVANALEIDSYSGNDYLEKIIQAPFDIPQISKKDVDQLLFSELKTLMDLTDKQKEQIYYDIYHYGMRYLFNNLRDVKRYINILSFNWGLVKDEVKPSDFLVITAIQVFIPDLYNDIKNNKYLFTGVSDNSEKIQKSEDAEIKEILEQIQVKGLPFKALEHFMQELFPKLKTDVRYTSRNLNNWRKELRICSPDIIDTYFKLSTLSDEISHKKMQYVLSKGNSAEAFKTELLKLSKNHQIAHFLLRMNDYTEKDIPEENIAPILSALMEIGDTLIPDSDYRDILEIFLQLLKRIQDTDARFSILLNAINNATETLHTIVKVVHYQYKNKDSSENLVVTSKQLKELVDITSKRIGEWADNGQLEKVEYPKILSILECWADWSPKLTKQFTETLIKDDEELIKLITLHDLTLHDYDANIKKYDISYRYIEHIACIKEIIDRLQKIKKEPLLLYNKLEEEQQFAIVAFLKIHKKMKESNSKVE